MATRECNFCGADIEPGTGMVYIRRDGAAINFCSKKCRVNMVKLKRVPRKTRWTREYHNLKAIKMASIEHANAEKLKEQKMLEPEDPVAKSSVGDQEEEKQSEPQSEEVEQ